MSPRILVRIKGSWYNINSKNNLPGFKEIPIPGRERGNYLRKDKKKFILIDVKKILMFNRMRFSYK